MSRVDKKAPELIVESWVQGEPSSIAKEKGKVISLKHDECLGLEDQQVVRLLVIDCNNVRVD